jgi:excisionase family DNA binding protein
MELNENEVYTPEEARQILKVSSSTMTRLIKQGLIHAAKVGKQYRILGKEILRLLSPILEDEVGKLYNKGRRWVHSDDPLDETQNLVKSLNITPEKE